MHTGLRALRAQIRGYQAEGLTLAHKISRASGTKRARLWGEKRALGVYTRLCLVAYGLLREVPYNRIERCAENNKLDAKSVHDLMRAHANWDQLRSLNIETVKSLLKTGEKGPQVHPENGARP